MLNQDFKDMLQSLSEANALFLIVGAYALAVHGFPRATGDMDIFVKANKENSSRIYEALSKFGAPMNDIDISTFSVPNIIFQMGVVPNRIDIITTIDGVGFDDAWLHRKIIEIEDIKISILSREDLIKNKKATGRDKDKADVKILEKNS